MPLSCAPAHLFIPPPQDADCACTAAHEVLAKSLAANSGGDGSLWAPHPDPAIRYLVDATTARFQGALLAMQDAFAQALTGHTIGRLAKAAPDAEHLTNKPPAQFTVDDWLLLVDTVVERFMPGAVLAEEAEAMVLKADILGRMKAILPAHQTLDLDTLAHISDLIPTEFARVPPRVLSPVELETLRFAKARAALHITDLTDDARSDMKRMVLEHLQAQALGQKEGTAEALRQRLSDTFGDLNRDFRRVAVSELGECCNQGYVAAAGFGAKLKRVEAYVGACDFCRSIDGVVLEVVSPDHPDKDGWRHIWIGKTNVGRSAAKRRWQSGELVDRGPEERWWPASGIQHPNCRGRWVPAPTAEGGKGTAPAGVSAEFVSFLSGLIRQATGGRGA
jgi:hypothetical protein